MSTHVRHACLYIYRHACIYTGMQTSCLQYSCRPQPLMYQCQFPNSNIGREEKHFGRSAQPSARGCRRVPPGDRLSGLCHDGVVGAALAAHTAHAMHALRRRLVVVAACAHADLPWVALCRAHGGAAAMFTQAKATRQGSSAPTRAAADLPGLRHQGEGIHTDRHVQVLRFRVQPQQLLLQSQHEAVCVD